MIEKIINLFFDKVKTQKYVNCVKANIVEKNNRINEQNKTERQFILKKSIKRTVLSDYFAKLKGLNVEEREFFNA